MGECDNTAEVGGAGAGVRTWSPDAQSLMGMDTSQAYLNAFIEWVPRPGEGFPYGPIRRCATHTRRRGGIVDKFPVTPRKLRQIVPFGLWDDRLHDRCRRPDFGLSGNYYLVGP